MNTDKTDGPAGEEGQRRAMGRRQLLLIYLPSFSPLYLCGVPTPCSDQDRERPPKTSKEINEQSISEDDPALKKVKQSNEMQRVWLGKVSVKR